MGEEIKKSVNDQAWGLRRQAQRIVSTHSVPVFSSAAKWVPVINVYWQLGSISDLPIAEGLFWHWMTCEKGATGWDAYARMHVRGTNAHFPDWQVSQWRFVAGEWHLFTRTPEPLLFADRLWIGLPSSWKERIRVYGMLRLPCKILQGVPIILVGNASGSAQQLVSLLRRSLNLEIDIWNGAETKSIPAVKGGYYRLLDSCHSRAGRTAFPLDTSKIGTVQHFQGGSNQHAKR